MINLDFSGVEERKPLEEGIYVLTIEDAEEKPAKSSGNPMISVKFGVEGHDQNKLFDNFVLTQKALWKLKEVLNALGYETDAIVDLDITELVGQQVQAKVVQEEYDGRMTNRIKSYYPYQ